MLCVLPCYSWPNYADAFAARLQVLDGRYTHLQTQSRMITTLLTVQRTFRVTCRGRGVHGLPSDELRQLQAANLTCCFSRQRSSTVFGAHECDGVTVDQEEQDIHAPASASRRATKNGTSNGCHCDGRLIRQLSLNLSLMRT